MEMMKIYWTMTKHEQTNNENENEWMGGENERKISDVFDGENFARF